MDNKDTGLLLNKKDIELHRLYFKQMVKLLGINVIYKAPRKDKHYDLHGELDPNYCEPIVVGCIFEEHVDQKTMKKHGWNAERQEGTSLIHVPYDLPGLQAGAQFIIPSGLDNAEGRVFKVLDMKVSPVYPSEITCELGPVLKSEFERSQLNDFKQTNLGIFRTAEDDED